MKTDCPTCGAEVDFRYDDSFVRVCTHCRSAVLRTDRGVESLGRTADLVDLDSPIKLFTEGRYRGLGFMVVGRTQLRHPAGGTWQEWYAKLDDGRWGWLAEAQGRYYLTFEIGAAGLIDYEQATPGRKVTVGERRETMGGEDHAGSAGGAGGEAPRGVDEAELVRIAASLERASEHPLAAAVIAGAAERGVTLATVTGFESVTGKGVRGTVDGHAVALGNRAMMEVAGIDVAALAGRAEALRGDGQTVMFVAIDGALAGLLGVADPIKPTTGEALAALKAEGLRIVMITGDSATTARAVAAALGLDDVLAEVLPDRKADEVKRLQASGRKVAMAGDGINDAPALAQADVGIAMGTGTDIAMETASITLVKGDLRGIVRARRLSHQTVANIKQNLFFAFIYNTAGVPIAAGVLYPVFGLLLSPMLAAAAMSLSSVSVITNALRLRKTEV